MKQAGPFRDLAVQGGDFDPPPDGASDVFPACGSLLDYWSPAILNGKIQISDLKAQYLPVRNACTSIGNQQSETGSPPEGQIINHTSTGTEDQLCFDHIKGLAIFRV
jgi:hypothetical protein